MDVGSHPVVLTRRVAEVHFGELSLEQQVAAVENGRTLLFDLCRTYQEQQRLPDARDLVRPAPCSPRLVAERLDSLGTVSLQLDRFFKVLRHPQLPNPSLSQPARLQVRRLPPLSATLSPPSPTALHRAPVLTVAAPPAAPLLVRLAAARPRPDLARFPRARTPGLAHRDACDILTLLVEP